MYINEIETNVETTIKNAEMLYLDSRYSRSAKCLDDSGFIACTEHDGHIYNIFLNIFHTKGTAVMEMGCGIVCLKEARTQVSEYIAQINCHLSEQKFQLKDTGEIFVCTEASLEKSPLETLDIFYMEVSSIKLLIAFSDVLNKLAHLKLIKAEETDVKKLIEKALNIRFDDFDDMDFLFDFDEEDEEADEEDDESIKRALDKAMRSFKKTCRPSKKLRKFLESEDDLIDDSLVFPSYISSTDNSEDDNDDSKDDDDDNDGDNDDNSSRTDKSFRKFMDDLFGDDSNSDEETGKECCDKPDSSESTEEKVNLMSLIMEEVKETNDTEAPEEDDDGDDDDTADDDNQ